MLGLVALHQLVLTCVEARRIETRLCHHSTADTAASQVQGVLSANGLIEKRSEPAQQTAQPVPEHFPGMKLGHLLGKGSYGRVFRGTWRGQTIAAKVHSSQRCSSG